MWGLLGPEIAVINSLTVALAVMSDLSCFKISLSVETTDYIRPQVLQVRCMAACV